MTMQLINNTKERHFPKNRATFSKFLFRSHFALSRDFSWNFYEISNSHKGIDVSAFKINKCVLRIYLKKVFIVVFFHFALLFLY